MTYTALPSYQGITLQVLHTYCGSVHHILRLNQSNKNQGTKPSADKEHDLTLPPKQYGKEGWLNKVLLYGRKTTVINKISGQELKQIYIFAG